ncbi:MAG: UDP-N-acetylglucosamine 1-carboxyvinyltransferase [Bdellovibrionaceae bacterium]|nr:UDP-N-acetylglucosamine 1-carboxyvinyltransferase [Pseudobdellovibrionaceae bacterium]
MDRIKIEGGQKLMGEVKASGAKNSSLPILFATLLAEGKFELNKVPHLADTLSTIALLEVLGCQSDYNNGRLIIDRPSTIEKEAPYDIVRKMRASILCLGPLVAKEKTAKVSLPGGCAIGSRPINLHLEALKKMGAQVELKDGYVYASAPEGLSGAHIAFDMPTVGGTENILMAATLAKGTTVINNAAREPEVVDLGEMLIKMGAKIKGLGTSIIEIEGVDQLHAVKHEVIADRIEVGTLLIAGAITGGKVKVTECNPEHLEAFLEKLKETGVKVEIGNNWIEVDATLGRLKSTNITTMPHPGFPTDLQAQFMTLLCACEGVGSVKETIFENRFMHVPELNRLGAEIEVNTRTAVVKGKRPAFSGTTVMATDLRASASLVLAGLIADGVTYVKRIYHLDRGYENLENKLASLGAKTQREKDL